MTGLPHNKIIDIEDFDNPSLRPYIEEIAFDEMIRFGLDRPEVIPDSKQWECAMMLKSFSDHGVTRPGSLFVGLGAGTEQTTFCLASKGCIVFPSDRYLENTPWSDVAPAGMMVRPQQYSNFDYGIGSVIPVHGDARSLNLPSNFFDGVYSAGSIEHFGSLEAVAAAAEEMGRILKPGGIASLSTEFRLEGPNGKGWFDDNCILFTPELIDKYIVRPSGLQLVDDLNDNTSAGTFNSQVVLLDFLSKAVKVSSIEDKRNAYPNLVLYHEGFLFCSVHLCLRKEGSSSLTYGPLASAFKSAVDDDNLAAAGVLTEQIKVWKQQFLSDESSEAALSARVGILETELIKTVEDRDRLAGDMHNLLAWLEKAGAQGLKPGIETIWEEYDFIPISRLYTLIGTTDGDKFCSKGQSGVLCYGPYMQLEMGHYQVSFEIEADDEGGAVSVDACYEQGTVVLGELALRSQDLSQNPKIGFSLDKPANGLEFRVLVSGEVDIRLSGIRIFRQRIGGI